MPARTASSSSSLVLLVPLKMIGFETGINWTLGLSFIRTSPDHGTAYNIAGKGVANPSSMRAAIQLAKQGQLPGKDLLAHSKYARARPLFTHAKGRPLQITDEAMHQVKQIGINHVLMGGPPMPWDEAQLDEVEGVTSGFYRKLHLRVATLDGDVTAWVYVYSGYEGGLPTAWYLTEIAGAAEKGASKREFVASFRIHGTFLVGLHVEQSGGRIE